MRTIRTLSIAVALAAAGLSAAAATLTVTFDNPIFGSSPDPSATPGGSDTISLWYPRVSGTTTTQTQLNVYAGRYMGVASNLVGINAGDFLDLRPADTGVQFAMYCYDLDQLISSGSVVANFVVDRDGESQRTRNFLGAVNAVLNDGKPQADPFAWLRPGTALKGAAIQIGIWESLYDASPAWNVNSSDTGNRGTFYASDMESETTTFLSAVFARLVAGTYLAVTADSVMVLRSSTAQDMITGEPPETPADTVPLPGTLPLLALGVAALVLRRRR